MRYNVIIEGKEYSINVAKQENISEQFIKHNNSIKKPKEEKNGADTSYEAAKAEYDYCIHRSEKLDNKIYILLTVCAFLIVVLVGIITDLSKIAFPCKINSCVDVFLRILWGITALEVLLFMATIIVLVSVLWSIDMYRFDSSEILTRDMVYTSKEQTIKYLCGLYIKCADHNNNVISRRYKRSNAAIILIVINTTLLLLIRILLVCMVR